MSADNWGICPKCKNPDQTLREDYEIGIYEGEFYIRYKGHCQPGERYGGCGFKHTFKHDEKIL
jgi:hypothetical protein